MPRLGPATKPGAVAVGGASNNCNRKPWAVAVGRASDNDNRKPGAEAINRGSEDDNKNGKAGVSYSGYWGDASDHSEASTSDANDDDGKQCDSVRTAQSLSIRTVQSVRSQSARSSTSSLPGAFREGGTSQDNIHNTAMSSADLTPSEIFTINSEEENENDIEMPNPLCRASTGAATTDPTSMTYPPPAEMNIAVANVVDEDQEQADQKDLPQAQSVPENALQRMRRQKHQHIKKVGMLVILVVIVVSISVGFGVALDPKESTPLPVPTAAPVSTPAPSAAQTSFEEYALSLLPGDTRQAIQGDTESPQARAFQWLLEDSTDNPTLEDHRVVQRFSLATLYFATGGEKWLKQSNWLHHSTSECDWYNQMRKVIFEGTPPTCDANTSRLEYLGLPKNNLIGVLPQESFLLTSLKGLDFRQNRLREPISSRIGQLTSLQGLWFDGLSNAGPIPTQLGLLTDLKILTLINNGHTGTVPTAIGALTNMRSLWMDGSPKLSGRLPNITGMLRLASFSMERCDVTGTIPTQVGRLKKARWLVMAGNRLHGTLPSELGLLSSNLQIASFYGNQLEGTLPTELGLMTSSTLLSFRANNFSGTIPSEFGSLTDLEVSLGVQNNPMLGGSLPTELGLLTNLNFLSFENNKHTGPIPSELGRLTSLGRLSIGNNSLTGTIPATLAHLQESLYHLDVQHNDGLSGTFPESLCTISGTCISHNLRPQCAPGTHVAFDCTDSFCGCDCSCSEKGDGTRIDIIIP